MERTGGFIKLPRYVVNRVEELKDSEYETPLRAKCEPYEFPLKFQDEMDMAIMVNKFKSQPFYSGLSGPSLDISKRIIILTIPRAEGKGLRCRTKVWFNPTYEPVGDETTEDQECCVSVKSMTALVKRFKTIRYKANDSRGNEFEGEVGGLTARIIQHEVDHLDGKLFIDLVSEEKLILIKDYVQSLKSANVIKFK